MTLEIKLEIALRNTWGLNAGRRMVGEEFNATNKTWFCHHPDLLGPDPMLITVNRKTPIDLNVHWTKPYLFFYFSSTHPCSIIFLNITLFEAMLTSTGRVLCTFLALPKYKIINSNKIFVLMLLKKSLLMLMFPCSWEECHKSVCQHHSFIFVY